MSGLQDPFVPVELISKKRDRAIVNGIKWLVNSDIGLTIEINIEMLEYGGEEHAIRKDITSRGKNIRHMLDNEET